MCSYRYKRPYFSPHRLPNTCQATQWFDQWPKALQRLTQSSADLPESLLEMDSHLPIDNHGHCLFHSAAEDWKRDQNCYLRFLQLLYIIWFLEQDLEEEERLRINLTEYQLTGIELADPSLKTKYNDNFRFVTTAITDLQLKKAELYFTESRFLDGLNIEECEFFVADFSDCTFTEEVGLRQNQFYSINFDNCTFLNGITIEECQFLSFTDFAYCHFHQNVRLTDVNFVEQVMFLKSKFETSFTHIQAHFQDFTDFTECEFATMALFSDCIFEKEVNFTDTIFRQRVFFKKNTIRDTFLIIRKNRKEDLFQDLVEFETTEEIVSGKIIFENVPFLNIQEEHRKLLTKMSRGNKVVIGKGCIKYRNQTLPKSLTLSDGNQTLVLDFVHTFVSYFINAQGLNLGFEILERDAQKIKFYYFSDENLSKKEFEKRLSVNEEEFLGLLFSEKKELEKALVQYENEVNENRFVNTIDGIAALMNTCMRVGVRMITGKWKSTDTQALLQSVRFNKAPIIEAPMLNQLLHSRYNKQQIINNTYQFFIKENREVNLQNSIMKIENQNIYGGNQQFADTIINSKDNYLSETDRGFLQLIYSHTDTEEERQNLLKSLQTVKSEEADPKKKEKAKGMLKKFTDSIVGELGKETVKKVMSGELIELLF